MNHALRIEQVHEPVLCGEHTDQGVTARFGGGRCRLFDAIGWNLDHVEHFVDHQAIPVVLELDHQMSRPLFGDAADAELGRRIDDGYDPAAEV
jgi:hypothetical protein